MEYAYGFVKKLQYFYNEINPATLTGAIDVIVVEQPDGTYQSTPFHVRFGKYGVLHSREKVIDITINGVEIGTKMKLGENGEAFFVEETEETDDFPDHLATSPLPQQTIDTDKVILEGIRTLKKQQRDEARSRVEQKRNQHRSTSRSTSRSRSPKNERRRMTAATAKEAEASGVNSHHQQQHNTAEYMVTQPSPLVPLTRARRIRSMPNLEEPDYGASRRVQHSVSIAEKVLASSSTNHQKVLNDSDSEGSQPVNSPDDYAALRDSKAIMDGAVSDSEADRCQLQLPTVGVDVKDWKWGELPDVDKTPTEEKPANSSNKPVETSSSGWTWFGWTRSSKRKEDQGIYLEDLEKSLEADPTVTAKYFGKSNRNARNIPPHLSSETTPVEDEHTPTADVPSISPPHQVPDDPIQELSDPDSPHQDHGYSSNPGSIFGESSTGRSSSPWPYDVQSCLEDCAFSLCGANGAIDPSTITEEQFNERRVSFEQFCNDPLLTAERQDLIMRINGRYYPRSVADAMLMSLIYFQKPLSEEKVNKLMDDYKHKMHSSSKSPPPSGGGWFSSWSRKGSSTEPEIKEETANSATIPVSEASSAEQKAFLEGQTRTNSAPVNIQRPSPSKSTTPPPALSVVDDEDRSEFAKEDEKWRKGEGKQRFVRSLRLPSDGLKALGLRKGMNEVRFSVTTKFQGTSWCMCHVYLWDWCDKIVISDIDGTITKSDVLGHIMPVIGGTWAHNGVAELYTGIKNNGYKMVYLSSRAIGQSSYTKHYLRTVVQDSNKMLPDGPMLLSPTSLLSAFRKEVIERKPYEFKIAALMDLKNLFPVKQPFYAGFGNRETDVKSYKAVNIAPERILTIDPNGVVRRADSIGYVSSYKGMAVDVVDYLFPPVIKTKKEEKAENQAVVQFTKPQVYSSFTHWRNAPISSSPIQDDELMAYEARRARGKSHPKK